MSEKGADTRINLVSAPLSKDIPAMLPQRRGTKRKVGHGAVVRDVLVEMTGDRFHPFICGHGRSLKTDTREPW